ncbi:MAG TPA: ACT domain-containing protein [Nocardioidaceae bacterium]|nr:ACT domain-containing protein [Nocardioidaceae bacterium]
MSHTLLQHDEPLAVVRLGAGSDIPAWAASGTLLSVTATAAETSIVTAHRVVPKKMRQEGPFTAFSVEGQLDLALTGVLHELLAPLAEAEVPVFTISTFDTDWILVPASAAAAAADAWRRSGHTVRPAHEHAEGRS